MTAFKKAHKGRETLRSNLAQEIISRRRGFLQRWSLFVMLAILIVVFSTLSLVKYPDIVRTRAIIKLISSQTAIVPKQNGILAKVLVSHGEIVSKGQVVGWLNSHPKTPILIHLSTAIELAVDRLEHHRYEAIWPLFAKEYGELGELQRPYTRFYSALTEYRRSLITPPQAGIVLKSNRKILFKDKTRESEIVSPDSSRLHITYNAFNKRLRMGLRLQDSLTQAFDKSLGKGHSSEKLKRKNSVLRKKVLFCRELSHLQDRCNELKEKVMLIALSNGRISFLTSFDSGDVVTAGKAIALIKPAVEEYYALTNIPASDIDRVTSGQLSQIHIDAYPYQHFGSLQGCLTRIDNSPSINGFPAVVEISNLLITSRGNRLRYHPGLNCDVIIITGEKGLLPRLLSKFFKKINFLI